MTLLLLYVFVALSISFLCSILEATFLSVRVYQLSARKEAGDRGAGILLALKEQHLDDSIAAILTLNTIAHTVGAALAGAQAKLVFGDPWVGVFAGVLTLLVLVFTEIIPKTLGTAHANRLVGFVGRTILLLTTLLRPVLAVTRLLTGALARHEQPAVSRGDLSALVSMADRSGALKEHETRVLLNILQFEQVLVEDVMTPRTVVKMLPETATVGDLLDDDEATGYSRIPICQGTQDNVVGYVLQRELLAAALKGDLAGEPLSRHLRKVRYLPEEATLGKALDLFLESREAMTLVVDEFGGVSGLVTLEDLLETILGVEILDELDAVADLRKSAAELRDRRLARHMRHEGRSE